jgi:hypothetical protein
MALSRLVLSLGFFLIVSSQLSAQPYDWYGEEKPYKWAVGLGWNFVEDDGRMFCQPFDVNQSWNGLPYPTRLTVDRYFKYGLSAEFAGAYMEYKAGKLIQDSTNRSGMFLSFDLNCRYSFYNLIASTVIDPYASLGFGYTQRNAMDKTGTFTGNVAFGVNFWVWKGLGINLQTSGKYGLAGDPNNSYAQHSIGLIYKFQGSDKNSNDFGKRKYKWIDKKQKYKGGGKKGG